MEEEQQIEGKKEVITPSEEKKPKRKYNIREIAGYAVIPLLLGGITMVGWVTDPNRPKKFFTYKATDDGKIEVTGRVKYNEVKKNWYLLEKQLNNGESRLYIVDCQIRDEFVNIHTDKKIASTKISGWTTEYLSDATILNIKHLEPYLITYDMVYDSYTIEDMDWLLELIEADYEYVIPDESNKVMMKTNE